MYFNAFCTNMDYIIHSIVDQFYDWTMLELANVFRDLDYLQSISGGISQWITFLDNR